MDYKTLYEQTKNLSLLLVEDYIPLQSDMLAGIEDFFKHVAVANNGEEALALYNTYAKENGQVFDIVVTDIVMPKMNGVELCEALLQRNEGQEIVVLSAYTESDYLLRLINLGISRFIHKPIDYEIFLETLYKIANKIGATRSDTKQEEKNVVDFGENTVWDRERSLLFSHGVGVPLSGYELLLLRLFVDKMNKVCKREEILYYFHLEGIELSERHIRNLIFKLRKKLPEGAIETVYALGYKCNTI